MGSRNIVALLLTGFLLLGCSQEKEADKQTQQAPPPLSVETVTVQKESVPIWLEYTGKTEASQRVEVRARVSGRLEEVLFQEGDVVSEGQKLFTIEKDTYQAAVDQAKAKLESNQASLRLALADVERYIPLVAEGLAPRVNLEQNEARAAELQAAIKADISRIKDAELNLSYTDVTAPITGRASRKYIDVGNIVGFGEKTLLTTIIGDDPMYSYFNPNEEQYQIIQRYKSKDILDAVVTVPNSYGGLLDRGSLKGIIDFKDNRVDPMTGTITMRATVPNPDRQLLEGTFVYVEMFVTDKPKFLMVHPSAIQEDQQGSFVYVVDENSSAKRVDIKRGFETRHYVLVPEGLQGGERVVMNGLAKIRPGVKLAPEDVTAAKGIMAMLKEKEMVPEKE